MTETWERGSWMQTFTGRQFYPLAPLVEDIDPLDIAHALSLQCRYNGHCNKFYSVAEHCVLMSMFVSQENALRALLHDATEAYIGDMVRPLKRHMPDFVVVEDKLMPLIAERFGVEGEIMVDEVKAADNRILLDEREALFDGTPAAWAVDGLLPLGVPIACWKPQSAEQAYLSRLEALLRTAVL
jgi:hypothetical protein